ncbi:hypothetical protein VNO80_22733 [Phaseolus coccineus]|uniref:Uncharacterized protein n=1 Tax=Phaseolus coccineus TaxID=3886 RepID=A0AAN9QZ09_PHACN
MLAVKGSESRGSTYTDARYSLFCDNPTKTVPALLTDTLAHVTDFLCHYPAHDPLCTSSAAEIYTFSASY